MILGIDTSCYTTSLAYASEGGLLAERRRLLPVKLGKCGVRQNEAFFQHIRTLPELFAELSEQCHEELTGVCVSAAPRAVKESYMPVFCAGLSVAKMLALQANIPLYTTTHQEGHLAAACMNIERLPNEFLALHISGGTTELLRVKHYEGGFACEILGAADLAAGQMIDRIGVALGLSFPAGAQLEQLAVEDTAVRLPVSVKGTQVFFSGPETAAQRLIIKGVSANAIAFAVFRCIADSLEQAILTAAQNTGLNKVVIAGGVACNQYIRRQLLSCNTINISFADQKFASDNAVGVALLGVEQERRAKR